MKTSWRNAWAIVLLACGMALLGSLAACHTVEGAGEDISAAGCGISTLADRARPYN